MRAAHPQRPARPLIVIGWDGATPELAWPWMLDGTLPTLASLRMRGVGCSLRSLVHPISNLAWTSAFTGLQPGRHGVFDFSFRVPGTMRWEPTDARQRHGAALWEIASQAGLRSVVVNVPNTWPAPADRRVHLVPGVGAPGFLDACSPPELGALVRAEAPHYRIDANSFDHNDPAEFLTTMRRMTEARTKVFCSLLRRERPDLGVAVFVSPDRVQHAFWKQSLIPGAEPERASWRFAEAIRDTWRQLDAALAEILEAAGPDATVLVLSDHGFGGLDGDLYLNTLLEEMGLLVVERPHRSLRERILGTPEPPLPLGSVRWDRSRAYARGLMGGVWLNLRGREPTGMVEPGPEAEALLRAIAERLLNLRAPGVRGRLIDAVFRGEDLHPGPVGDRPDLVVVPREYRFMTRSGREIGPRGEIVGPVVVRHTGNHRLDGILVGAGPGVSPLASSDAAQLIDICPTALALLGIEVPRSLDGVVLEELLSCGVAYTDEVPAHAPPTSTRTDEERERIDAQMRGLGYFV